MTLMHLTITEERWKMLKRKKEWIEEIERLTGVKIEMPTSQEIVISGEDPIKVLRVKEILRALGRGFDFQSALSLLDENQYLEIINLRDYTKSRNRQIELKGRVIGKDGSTKKRIEEVTGVKIAVYGKTIGIIGPWKNVQIAKRAVEMLLGGAMHETVYRFLKRQII